MARISSRNGSTVITRWRSALVANGHAYYCYCSPERLQQKRREAEAAGGAWIYDRRCLSIDLSR